MSKKMAIAQRSEAWRQAPHPDAGLHVTGEAKFIADEPRPSGLCFAAVVPSAEARAKIASIDAEEALKFPGVIAVLTAKDIPGDNIANQVWKDEPVLAADEVNYNGEPVAVVVAGTEAAARNARGLVKVKYRPLAPCLTLEEARRRKNFLGGERRIARGDVEAALAKAPHVIEGRASSGSQEHFYLETQICRAVPEEGGKLTLFSSTQSISEVQETAARMLGRDAHDVTVDVKRLGGGFGGKENGAIKWACLAALAAAKTGRPVELRLTREEDVSWTGKRHPFTGHYRVGFDHDGRVLAYDLNIETDGGAYVDLTMAILERAMLHADNAYYLPSARIIGRAYKTNSPVNTAFRGFGAPQGVFIIERAIERIARTLGLDPFAVRARNAYREGQPTPYGQPVRDAHLPTLLARLRKNSNYDALRRQADRFNAAHPDHKRGLGIVPVKFGVSFTTSFLNQGSALVWVYTDGSVSVTHGGIEMGQEVNTKVAQVTAHALGVPLSFIRVESANTKRVANAPSTAASVGADLNGQAARIAAETVRGRLAAVAARMLAAKTGRRVPLARVIFEDGAVFDKEGPAVRVSFREVACRAHRDRVDLGAKSFYRTPGVKYDQKNGRGTPFHYFVNGAALVLTEIELATGSSRMIEAQIVHETGRSLNKAIDLGQIEGGFLQGCGWMTIEEMICGRKGEVLTSGPSTYKIPTCRDLPARLRIEMVEGGCRYASVYGSKAVGEPPFIYGEAAFLAIKDAVEAVAGHCFEAEFDAPATPETVYRAIGEMAQLGEEAEKSRN